MNLRFQEPINCVYLGVTFHSIPARLSKPQVKQKGSSKKFRYKELPVNFEFPTTLDLRKK